MVKIWYNNQSQIEIRGVDQLVDRLVWDQEVVRSSRATPTKKVIWCFT